MRKFELIEGVPYREDSELTAMLADKGKLTKVDMIAFDDDHYRFVEFWDLSGTMLVTEYDIRYEYVEEAGPDGILMVRKGSVTPKHLCEHVDFDLLKGIPKEDLIEDA